MHKKHLLFVLPIVSAFLALFSGYALVAQSATTIYVDADASGLGNGSSWDNAYTDLQTALSVAASPQRRHRPRNQSRRHRSPRRGH